MHPHGLSEEQAGERVDETTVFVTGDVMTGRGIDQVLLHPGDPEIFESYVELATGYVRLAEEANGTIPRPVDFDYVWGDAVEELHRRRPAARLVNLETAVTANDEPYPKGINYRMNPGNAPVLTAAGIDVCALANNHVLDWGEKGLLETLGTLKRIGIRTAGAGADQEEASRPAFLLVPGGRVALFAFASPTSGVPHAWAAGKNRPGVNLLPALDATAARAIAGQVRQYALPADVVVVSLHWGGNWGYDILPEQREFAHRLIDDAGVDIVWGHSSHHPKAIEVHNGRLILFGCGDFLNDYEGIRGHEQFRSDIVLMYFPTVESSSGTLRELAMTPLRIRNFGLRRASADETHWLSEMLNREGVKTGTRVEVDVSRDMQLHWN